MDSLSEKGKWPVDGCVLGASAYIKIGSRRNADVQGRAGPKASTIRVEWRG
jgi:hypothetical protein